MIYEDIKTVRKTLNVLLKSVKNIKDLELIDYTIEDYEEEGHKLDRYRGKIEKLKESYSGKNGNGGNGKRIYLENNTNIPSSITSFI